MSLAELAVTLDEFRTSIDTFIARECEKKERYFVHKNCGSAIRTGYLNLFYLNDDGSLDPGSDGFGIGPKRVPYCERCFPPDGFKDHYAFRFPILRERKIGSAQSYMVWGNQSFTDRTLGTDGEHKKLNP